MHRTVKTMAVFEWIYRYFWLIGMVTGGLNTAIMWGKLQRPMREHPERIPGYLTLLRGY